MSSQVLATLSCLRNNTIAIYHRLYRSSSKFPPAALLCLPRGLSPPLPLPYSPIRPSRLPAVCLPTSGSDLSISHKLSVPSLECPLTLIRLELPAAFPFALSQFQFLLPLGGSRRPRPQSQPVKVEDTGTTCECLWVVSTQACRLPELTFWPVTVLDSWNVPTLFYDSLSKIHFFPSPLLNHLIAY